MLAPVEAPQSLPTAHVIPQARTSSGFARFQGIPWTAHFDLCGDAFECWVRPRCSPDFVSPRAKYIQVPRTRNSGCLEFLAQFFS